MGSTLPVQLRDLSGKQKLVYGVGLTGGLALAAPVAVLVLTTVTSLVMTIVIGLLAFGGFLALPVLFRWWRIQVFKMLKATARKSPVETLQLELIGRKNAFEMAGRKIVAISAQRDSLRERLEDFQDKFGRTDAEISRAIDKLSTLVDRLRASLRQTGVGLDEFERFVERQAERWELAKAAGELAESLNETGGSDVTDTFLKDEAILTIRNALNLSFAEIDDILEREEVKQLTRFQR